MKDFYTRKSREEGYYARSVYKLKQINKKYNLIRTGDKVLDLGCSPGGWVQASLELIGNKGFIIGIDINNVKEIKAQNFQFIKADIETVDIDGTFNVILSDMAPKTTGDRALDQERSYSLSMAALKICDTNLVKKGNFLCKIFQGGKYPEFLKEVKKRFEFVKTMKPEASKSKSKEMYVIGKCMKPKKE